MDDAEHEVEHVLRQEPVTEDQARRCVQEMRSGSASGLDTFSANTLKNNIDFVLSPLVHIVNISITSGVFPDVLKIAKVSPLFKSSDKSNINNYRPISLMSVVSRCR